jgi:hypothetical protein
MPINHIKPKNPVILSKLDPLMITPPGGREKINSAIKIRGRWRKC